MLWRTRRMASGKARIRSVATSDCFSHGLACNVSCKPVQVNGGDGRFEDALRILRDQSGGHAGENVAGTACGHARVAGRIDPDRSIGMCDQCAMTFEDDDHLMVVGKRTGDVDAVTLHRSHG